MADIRQLEQQIAAVEARIKAAVAESKTTLVELFGVGPVLAATFLGEVGDIGRFPSRHHFAAHTGTAPLEASSGQVIRHRLSRAGDRKLNHALYMMAMVQVRRPSAGQAYYQRKLAEGKSPKEASGASSAGCPMRSIGVWPPISGATPRLDHELDPPTAAGVVSATPQPAESVRATFRLGGGPGGLLV